MIGFDEALDLLKAAVQPLAAEQVPLSVAHGRVLAEPVHAALPSPRRAVSAMDGYALRDADAAVGASLRVVAHSFAGGELPPPLQPGQAARIFTGAALPDGADWVVMQENCEADGDMVTIARPFGPGRHIRAMGSDFAEGDLILPAGRLLDPQALVALAGADRAETQVHKAPRVAVIATGDELAAPGTARGQPLAIPESVSFGIAAMAVEQGARLVGKWTGADSLPDLERTAQDALGAADVVLVTGGASVGERDFAKAMFRPHGLDIVFPKVAIKPGKPVWLGRAGQSWVLGLPGNPTSAMVTARLFLSALLAALQGRETDDVLQWYPLPLAAPLPATGDRTTFVRALWTASGLVPVRNQDSGAQGALAQAGWLIRCDAGQPALAAGTAVSALQF